MIINIKETINLLSEAGIFPSIIVVGSWIYVLILIIVFLCNLTSFMFKKLQKK